MTEEEDVFLRAIELPREHRGSFLSAVCLGDEALQRRVKELLEAHEAGEGILDRPGAEPATINSILREMPVSSRGGRNCWNPRFGG